MNATESVVDDLADLLAVARERGLNATSVLLKIGVDDCVTLTVEFWDGLIMTSTGVSVVRGNLGDRTVLSLGVEILGARFLPRR